MKKSFFIGLLLVSVVLGFAGCKQPVNGPVVTEKRFVARTTEGPYIEYTKIYHDGIFSGKVIMNKIHDGTKEYEINKDCSWEKSGVTFGEPTTISGQTLNNLEWENGNAWCVNCYDSNKPAIKVGEDTLARIYFGWCTSSNKTEKTFVISAVKYLANGTEDNFLGVTSYIAIPVTEKRFVATAIDEPSLSIDFSEIWEGDKFSGRIIMNKITYGGKVFTLNKDCRFKKSNTTFSDITSGDTILHQYDWTNTEKFVWGVDCSDINYQLPNGRFVTYVEFGSCTCSCIEGKHFVITIITKASKDDSNYSGMAYFTTLERIK